MVFWVLPGCLNPASNTVRYLPNCLHRLLDFYGFFVLVGFLIQFFNSLIFCLVHRDRLLASPLFSSAHCLLLIVLYLTSFHAVVSKKLAIKEMATDCSAKSNKFDEFSPTKPQIHLLQTRYKTVKINGVGRGVPLPTEGEVWGGSSAPFPENVLVLISKC